MRRLRRSCLPKLPLLLLWRTLLSINNPDDAWVAIDGKGKLDFTQKNETLILAVYDITTFWRKHPGGRLILAKAGADATDDFYAFHTGQAARVLLKTKQVGVLVDAFTSPLLEDFRSLRKQFEEKGYFNSNKLYFAAVFAGILALQFVGYLLLHILPDCFFNRLLCSSIVGLAYGQCGFLMHDFCHKSVFHSKSLNRYGQIVTYGLLLGGSPSWWKGRHNRHHVAPNHRTWDLDIRTLPLFAWDHIMAKKAPSSLLRFQAFYWCFLGPPFIFLFYKVWNFVFILKQDKMLLPIWILHHLSWLPLVSHMGFWGVLGWNCLVLMWMGNYLGWVFALNHYMHPLHEKDYDWVTSTALTTQNIKPSNFISWFTGGLCYQIEHHLFPTMPRSSYSVVHKDIVRLFRKHQLPFLEVACSTAFCDVIRTLNTAADALQ